MILKVKKIDERAVVPQYAHNGDACFDLSVLIDSDANAPMLYDYDISGRTKCFTKIDVNGNSIVMKPNSTLMFHTGLKFETEIGYNMKVYVRSSTGMKKNLILSNGTGVIDTAQYRGELMIGLTNIGNSEQTVVDGERVAQAEIVKTLDVDIVEVDELSDTERGEGGIGSTGGH